MTPVSLRQGIKKQGKGLKHFYSAIALSAAILYFRTMCALLRSRNTPRTWCLLRCCHAEVYLGASISVPYAKDRSIGLPELRHFKRHFQTDPDVEIQKPNCCCVAPDGWKHVKLKKRASTKFRCQGPGWGYCKLGVLLRVLWRYELLWQKYPACSTTLKVPSMVLQLAVASMGTVSYETYIAGQEKSACADIIIVLTEHLSSYSDDRNTHFKQQCCTYPLFFYFSLFKIFLENFLPTHPPPPSPPPALPLEAHTFTHQWGFFLLWGFYCN